MFCKRTSISLVESLHLANDPNLCCRFTVFICKRAIKVSGFKSLNLLICSPENEPKRINDRRFAAVILTHQSC
jgi:hypothetical protein